MANFRKATKTLRWPAGRLWPVEYFVNVPPAASPVQTVERLSSASEVVRSKTDMSVLIPALNEGQNLAILLPWLRRILEELDLSYEVIVVTTESDHGTIEAAVAAGARVLFQVSKGYGGALIDGVRASRGEYILTLDADLSHRPDFVREMWNARHAAEITIASRYVPGGTATMPKYRLYLSRVLNVVFRRGLSMPLRDLSSGFRLYRRSVFAPDTLKGRDFDLLQEILVKAYCEGWKVQESRSTTCLANMAAPQLGCPASVRPIFAPSGACGSYVTPYKPLTMTTVPFKARSRCSAIGKGRAFASSAASRRSGAGPRRRLRIQPDTRVPA